MKSGTCIPPTTAASVPSRRRKVPTSASSCRLSTYARVNEFGFIETPYRVVEKLKVGNVIEPRVTREVRFLSALGEEDMVIGQANAKLDPEGRFLQDLVEARQGGQYVMVSPEKIDYWTSPPASW